MHRRPFVPTPAVFHLRVVAERFDVLAKLDERAEGGDPRDFALHQLSDLVRLEPVAPDVVHLLDTEGNAAVLRIDLEHFGCDWLALAEDFVRVLHSPRPAYVANVHKAVKAVLDFDESAKLRDVAHFPGDHRAHGIFVSNLQPRIRNSLLHAQRNAAGARLDVQHNPLHRFLDLHYL